LRRDYKLFIKDILVAIDAINDFIGTMSFKSFQEDEKPRVLLFENWKLLVKL